MKLPKKKKIEGKIWRISQVEQPVNDDGEICWGVCDYNTRTIFIKARLAKEEKLKTYLHEILHAALHEIGLELGYSRDEITVQKLENIICRLFRLQPK